MDFLQGNEGRQDSSNLQFLIGDKCRGTRYLDANTPSNISLEGTANSAAFIARLAWFQRCARRPSAQALSGCLEQYEKTITNQSGYDFSSSKAGTLSQSKYYRSKCRRLCLAGSLCKERRHSIPKNNYSQPKSDSEVSIMKKNEIQFDDEEIQILGDFERGEFESIKNFRDEKRKLETSASNTLQKISA